MNDIIRYVLPKYLDYSDLTNLSIACKYHYYLLKDIVAERKSKKIEQIKDIFNFFIIDIVNKKNLINARYIQWNDKWNEKFFKDFNQFKGTIAYTKDESNRGFIFTKVKVEIPTEKNLPFVNYTIMVIYQKYSDIQVYFVSDPENYCITSMNGGIFMEREYCKHFKTFFSLGTFSYLDFPYELPFPALYQKIYIFKEYKN